MTVLLWNCHGLGKPEAVEYLLKLVESHYPNIIFLCETISLGGGVLNFRQRIKYGQSFEVERVGLSGGLGLIWKNDCKVTIRSSSSCHIDAEVIDAEGKHWHFTGVYGYTE